MPTGLTYDVVDDPPCSFEAFALRCARQMAVLGYMRDESGEAPPRLPNPDTVARARGQLDLAQTKLAAAKALTLEQAERDAQKSHDSILADEASYAHVRAVRRGRARAMMMHVEDWKVPPTHAALKAFMMQQLKDTYDEYAEANHHRAAPIKKTAAEWIAFMIGWRTEEVASAEKDVARAEESFARRTEWVTALYESLGMKPLAHDDFKTNPFKKKTNNQPENE